MKNMNFKAKTAIGLVVVFILSGCGGGGGSGNGASGVETSGNTTTPTAGNPQAGTIQGLITDGLVLSNGRDRLEIPAGSSSFKFTSDNTAGVDVSIAKQPYGLTQACELTKGAGLQISCGPASLIVETVAGDNAPSLDKSISIDNTEGQKLTLLGVGGDESVFFSQSNKLFKLTGAGVAKQLDWVGETFYPGGADGSYYTLSSSTGALKKRGADDAVVSVMGIYPSGIVGVYNDSIFTYDSTTNRITTIRDKNIEISLSIVGAPIAVDDQGNILVNTPENPAAPLLSSTMSVISRQGKVLSAKVRQNNYQAALLTADGRYAMLRDTYLEASTRDGKNIVIGDASLTGYRDGLSSFTRFGGFPAFSNGLLLERNGSYYLNDGSLIRKIMPDGTSTTLSRQGFASPDRPSASASFDKPKGVAVDKSTGNVFVIDAAGMQVKIVRNGVVSSFAGALTPGLSNGKGSSARLGSYLGGISVDQDGVIYVSDNSSLSGVVRKIFPDGSVGLVAGIPGVLGQPKINCIGANDASVTSWDGSLDIAYFRMVEGVAAKPNGELLVINGVEGALRLVSKEKETVSTLVGPDHQVSGSLTVAQGYGSSCSWNHSAQYQISNPISAVASDSAGNAYMAAGNQIWSVSPTRSISIVAGASTAGHQDGPNTIATFNGPTGIAVDDVGTIYVADTGNHSIRKISTDGQVSTLAGVYYSAGDKVGAAALARFNTPMGLAIDADGNVVIADSENNKIKRLVKSVQH